MLMQQTKQHSRLFRALVGTMGALALGLGLPGAIGVASAHHGSTSTVCPATTTVIPGGTTYTLTHDVLGCSVTAFHVGAGATLDLNGFRISGTSTNTLIGVKVTGDFAIVTNTHPTNAGIIEDFGAGVEVRNRYFAVVSNLTVRDNNNGASSPIGSPGEGIALWNTVNTTVEDNTVSGNGPYAGIGVYGTSSGNVIQRNTVSNNNLNRPVAGGGSNNETIGIRMDQLTSGTIVDGNTVTDSGLDGISAISGSGGHVITNNTVNSNGDHTLTTQRKGDGIRINGPLPPPSTDNVVKGNTVEANACHGISAWSGNSIIMNTSLGHPVTPGDACYDLFDGNPVVCDNVWAVNTFVTDNDTTGCIS